MNDNEKLPHHRPGHPVPKATGHLTATATTELHRLLDLLADTSDAASEILRRSARPPAAADLDRLREIAARIDAMVERIKAILS